MQDGMADAIRSVVNFARFDEKYSRLQNADELRQEYFEERFAQIAEENGVDKDELRSWLAENLRPESFGLDIRTFGNEEVAIRRF